MSTKTLGQLANKLQNLIVVENSNSHGTNEFLRLRVKHEKNLKRYKYLVNRPRESPHFTDVKSREKVTIPGKTKGASGVVIHIRNHQTESGRQDGKGSLSCTPFTISM